MLTYEVLKDRYTNLKKSHNALFNELVKTDKENKHLNKQLDQALKDYDKLQNTINKIAIWINKYTDKNILDEDADIQELINIITGEENE